VWGLYRSAILSLALWRQSSGVDTEFEAVSDGFFMEQQLEHFDMPFRTHAKNECALMDFGSPSAWGGEVQDLPLSNAACIYGRREARTLFLTTRGRAKKNKLERGAGLSLLHQDHKNIILHRQSDSKSLCCGSL